MFQNDWHQKVRSRMAKLTMTTNTVKKKSICENGYLEKAEKFQPIFPQ